ncbi:MAG: hypothetical protein WBE37_21365 [Bryobacteraceae bacterium]
MTRITVFAAICAGLLSAQNTAPADQEHWSALSFLEGTWDARTQGGTAGASASGTYIFKREVGGHLLARHSSGAGCKGPGDFDCDHSDLLLIYQEAPGQPLQGIYFDNEGHVIHYTVSTPALNSAVLTSDASAPGPHYRLVYKLEGGVMSGKFQIQMPGKTPWRSYLEWSGDKR